jgi:hypothetical protein
MQAEIMLDAEQLREVFRHMTKTRRRKMEKTQRVLETERVLLRYTGTKVIHS